MKHANPNTALNQLLQTTPEYRPPSIHLGIDTLRDPNQSLAEVCQAHTRAMAAAIARLEHTVHEQIYQENQVLFPRALAC